MHRAKTLTALVSVSLAAVAANLALSAGRRTVAASPAQNVDACRTAEAWAAANEDRGRTFGATSEGESYDPSKSRWREYQSKRALEADASGGTLFYTATVWSAAAGIVVVRTEETSFSGDWGLRVDYCFRASAQLARIDSELRMLPSDAITRETSEYDERGRRTRQAITYHDLTTGAELSGEAAQAARQYKIPVRVYKRTSELPFYQLLAPRR